MSQNENRNALKDRDNKGFTLVELIVVLVILAILAAILVPALLGYVDKAKESKYVLEANGIYKALQTLNTERYAKMNRLETYVSDGCAHISGSAIKKNQFGVRDELNKLISPTEVISFGKANVEGEEWGGISYKKNGAYSTEFTSDQLRDWYVINKIDSIVFRSEDGTVVEMTWIDGAWEVENMNVDINSGDVWKD